MDHIRGVKHVFGFGLSPLGPRNCISIEFVADLLDDPPRYRAQQEIVRNLALDTSSHQSGHRHNMAVFVLLYFAGIF